MLGELFIPRETPEAPKTGFLKSLFGGGVSTLDREELCKYDLFFKILLNALIADYFVWFYILN